MKMIETIRLFRKKEDDMWILFITEFFKFIGCIVCDCELRQKRVLSLEVEEEYDINLFFGVDLQEVIEKTESESVLNLLKNSLSYEVSVECKQFGKIIFTPEFQNVGNKLEKFYIYAEEMLKEIVADIWRQTEVEEELLQLCELYCENNLFFYFYNEGSRKFVKEQEYSFRIRYDIEKALQETAEESYNYFKIAHNKLYEKNKNEMMGRKKSPYYSYAELVLMYKLNQKMTNIELGNVFSIEKLLERAEEVMEEVPEFIRINYLAGSICKNSNEYYREAEKYFVKTLKLIKQKNAEGLNAFVYYRLGELEENIFKDKKIAWLCYRNAYYCNREYYPVMLKLAKSSGSKNARYLCNKVISIVLNGYEMCKVMPKQQVYVYEAFKILGDIFKKNEEYALAEKSYNNAIELAETTSQFYVLFNKNTNIGNGFYEIVKRSMPVEPITYRLIKCATKVGDQEKVEKYFREMRE